MCPAAGHPCNTQGLFNWAIRFPRRNVCWLEILLFKWRNSKKVLPSSKFSVFISCQTDDLICWTWAPISRNDNNDVQCPAASDITARSVVCHYNPRESTLELDIFLPDFISITVSVWTEGWLVLVVWPPCCCDTSLSCPGGGHSHLLCLLNTKPVRNQSFDFGAIWLCCPHSFSNPHVILPACKWSLPPQIMYGIYWPQN